MALDGIRYPEVPRVPIKLPITNGWITLVYNPQDDNTYSAQMQELPFLQSVDMYRVLTWAAFDAERKKKALRLGRTTRIISRVGTRPDSVVIVSEIGPDLTGNAIEIDAASNVAPVLYNPVDDSIGAFGVAAIFQVIPKDYWKTDAPPFELKTQTEANDYFGRMLSGLSASPSAPAAPTNGVVNDIVKEFTFTVNPAYPSYTQYKEVGRPGSTAPIYLSTANAYQVGSTVHVTGLSGAAKSSLGYYVAGSGNRPDGAVLTNNEAFTGAPSAAQPTAPKFAGFDDVANTVSVSHDTLPVSELVYDFNGATGVAVPLNNVISVGNLAGQVVSYARANGTRPEGLRASSQPFTIAATQPSAPTVTISSPQAGQSVNIGQSVTLNAIPQQNTNPISRVEFYEDGTKIGESFSSPYTMQRSVGAGTHNYTARVIDTAGLSNSSNSISITGYTAVYDNKINGGDSYDEVAFGAITSDTLEFNNVSDKTDKTPVTMDLYVSGDYVASIPYVAYRTGKPFRYMHNGLNYTNNFTAARIDL